MMEMDVNQPTPAISLTSKGTLGEAYVLNLHMMQPVEWQNAAKEVSLLEAACSCATYCVMADMKQPQAYRKSFRPDAPMGLQSCKPGRAELT